MGRVDVPLSSLADGRPRGGLWYKCRPNKKKDEDMYENAGKKHADEKGGFFRLPSVFKGSNSSAASTAAKRKRAPPDLGELMISLHWRCNPAKVPPVFFPDATPSEIETIKAEEARKAEAEAALRNGKKVDEAPDEEGPPEEDAADGEEGEAAPTSKAARRIDRRNPIQDDHSKPPNELLVAVCRAKGLPIMDAGGLMTKGSSDPLVCLAVVDVSQKGKGRRATKRPGVVKGAVAAAVSEKAETTVQKKTLCPRWDEVFALGLPEVRHATCADT